MTEPLYNISLMVHNLPKSLLFEETTQRRVAENILGPGVHSLARGSREQGLLDALIRDTIL